MQQIPNYGDQRTLAFCAFCGGETGTRDHCPSKVLLDEPYPENLLAVPACRECNSSFSADEEYLACLVSCVLAGSTDPELMPRAKISRVLRKKPALRTMLEQTRLQIDGKTMFIPDEKRVSSVLIKLAQGHALYELHESCARKPDEFKYTPFELLSTQQREFFENPEASAVFPEVGSRAMQRLVIVGSDVSPYGWINVQHGRYRFHASLGNGIEIQIVINEYLACFARWEY